MVKRLVLLFAVTLLLCFDLFAQKIKYKDLFVLLNAKDYNVAEPFLRRFMLQDPDHPNANFNMALFYIFQLAQQDPLIAVYAHRILTHNCHGLTWVSLS